jgi:hypothetical protein
MKYPPQPWGVMMRSAAPSGTRSAFFLPRPPTFSARSSGDRISPKIFDFLYLVLQGILIILYLCNGNNFM